jgi:hypothetical protein
MGGKIMARSIVLGVCLLAVGLLVAAGCKWPEGSSTSGEFGCFEGEVVAVWDPGGRTMTLRDNFAYVDAHKKRWTAPKGSVTDGASIPRPFWSVVGGPFEGPYRNAAVVHDVACQRKNQPWKDVHRMFYEACRCGGVEDRFAKLLYWAVYHYGPQWELASSGLPGIRTYAKMPARAPAVVDDDVARRAKAYFEANSPSLADIESLTLPAPTPAPTNVK